MAFIINLQKRQIPLDVIEANYLNFYAYESETTTQVDLFSDSALTSPMSQPVVSSAAGVFPDIYVASGVALRHLITDQNDVAIAGYHQDNVTPEPVGQSNADQIGFTPIEGIEETTVQAAIESVHATASSVDAVVASRFTPFTTGGSANAYTLTPDPAMTAYNAGQSWLVRPDRANTGAATLDVSTVGARNLMKYGPAGTLVALAAGELQPYRELIVYDDGVQIIAVLGRDYPIITTNANGTSVRWASGWQECTKALIAATYATTTRLSGSWTFPQAFSVGDDLYVDFTPTSGANFDAALTDVSVREVGMIIPHTPSTTACGFHVHTAAATTDTFTVGDNAPFRGNAKGRWF